MLEYYRHLNAESATVAAGSELGELIADCGGAIVFLLGDLGAGKTTFTRGVLQAFGHSGSVKSPTYTLVEPYEFAHRSPLFHFDLYRLGDPEELEYMGIRDYFMPGNTCLIEWPRRGEGVLPAADLEVTLAVERNLESDGVGRSVRIHGLSTVGEKIVQELKQSVESKE